jgi:hypothetical protein
LTLTLPHRALISYTLNLLVNASITVIVNPITELRRCGRERLIRDTLWRL